MLTGELRGVVVADADFAKLGQLLGQQVVISGTAKFRPSGRVLRVEADQIVAAEGDTTPWETRAERPLASVILGRRDPVLCSPAKVGH